ncbi:MAG: S8 family serine peptidase [Marmoricola sp.]
MAQIVHDVAPGAKLCFATAFGSEIGFADNIRKLADKKGKCGADVIVDDVGYFDEPMFSDGILNDAINDVAKKGVHYFSSAGNDGEDNSWNSDTRLIPAKQGVKGTNLDFSDVDPALYDGGLQDMNPGSGTDVAQNVHVGDGQALLNLQWNDPLDVDGATYGDPLFQASGTLTTATPARTHTWNAPASQVGKQVEFRTDGVPSGTTDLVLQVTDPDGNNLGEIDTGSSPEVLAATVTKAGPYKITISGYDGATGPYTVLVRDVLAPSRVSTDFNVLLFDPDGAYLGALADLNPLSGRPQELAALDGIGDIQYVISRSGTGKVGATKLRTVLSGDLYFTEYSDPLSPAFSGHPMAAGATSVAAYDPFKSYLPEPYTSPGGRLPVYFDSSGDKYSSPQIRQVPTLASSDRGNTTFFAADDLRDADTQPNFGGTSASAPHAAAIAALVLQKAGGPKSLSPTAMRRHLQASAYDHDLDPMTAGGSAKGLTVTAKGNQGRENSGTTPGSINDPNFFRVSYSGSGSVKSLTFYGETASPTAPGKRNPPKSDGIVFDKRPYTGVSPWINQGFPFTVGAVSGGLSKSSVTPTFSVPGGGSAVAGQYRRLTVSFKNGLKSGQGLRFGVDRDIAASPYGGTNEGNGADELGGAIFMPQGTGSPQGMVFVATLSNGKKISGVFTNKLGSGWSPVDGFGVINAEKAVNTAR